jgi:hypothetical protein
MQVVARRERMRAAQQVSNKVSERFFSVRKTVRKIVIKPLQIEKVTVFGV